MSYRCIYVRYADKMSLRDNNLVVKNQEREVTVPLEDISIVLLEDPKSVITARLMAELASHFIGLIVCDERYLPCSITLPLNMHYKQFHVFKMQMNVSKPFNSQCWERIIKAKICSQRRVIEMTSMDLFTLEKLETYEKEVKSGDKTNREGLAAKVFFEGIYGEMFKRRQSAEDEINSALNYGYTLLATNMSRLLSMYGLNTMIGIHHHSEMNNFNLSYDLVEPYRVLVDRYVFDNIDNLNWPLTTDIKKGLIGILVESVRINGRKYLVEHAMEETVLSYIQAIENEDSKRLFLPEILERNQNEDDDFV